MKVVPTVYRKVKTPSDIVLNVFAWLIVPLLVLFNFLVLMLGFFYLWVFYPIKSIVGLFFEKEAVVEEDDISG
jgi:uncharacterized membrane protein